MEYFGKDVMTNDADNAPSAGLKVLSYQLKSAAGIVQAYLICHSSMSFLDSNLTGVHVTLSSTTNTKEMLRSVSSKVSKPIKLTGAYTHKFLDNSIPISLRHAASLMDMQKVIDLCSDDEIQPNPQSKSEETPSEEIDQQNGDAAVKWEQVKDEVLNEDPHRANGTIAQQNLAHQNAQLNKNRKRKRGGKSQQHASHLQDSFSDDEKLQDFRTEITEAQRAVQRCHDELNQATSRLKDLEEQFAERLKLLRRRADERFNWLSEFPWHDKLLHQLNHVFRITSFRPFQHEALNATLLRRDVFSILPTGAGKSLIYQLAAVVDGGLTLVVTPLLSLSMDQRMALRRLNVRAESIDSITDKSKVKRIYNELLPNRGKVPGSKHPRKRRMRGQTWISDDMKPAILFVTPEQIAKSKRLMGRLEGMHENGHLSRICIDEAHCASLWGHDFRSEYRKLGILRRQLPDAPILALTATCSAETTEDVCKMLETRNCVLFRGSIDRPNLFYEVREKGADDTAVLDDILGWIRDEFADMCGIIYVLARKDAVNYAEALREAGIKAGCYHGDLERGERNKVHAAWSDGRVQVVVATIAFGLGIDNPRVRFVIHATMATSLEGYYQESGRAGRDGKPAKCVLLHRAKEFPKMSGFVADKGGDRLQKMYEMYRYASSRGLETLCRRAVIAQAFGEVPPDRKDNASCCDICAARSKGSYGRVVVDVTDLARSVGRIVLRIAMDRPDDKFTLLGIASDWGNTGAKGKRMRGDEKAIARKICIDTRLEIMVGLVLIGVLEEYHRHSSYSVNAYVTSGENAGQAFDGDPIRIVVTKEKAMRLVKEGCRIVGGVGEWESAGKEIVEEEAMDAGDGYDEIYQEDNEEHLEDDVLGREDENEQIVGNEETTGEGRVDHGEFGHQQTEVQDQNQEDDEEQSDEEVILRKRIRV